MPHYVQHLKVLIIDTSDNHKLFSVWQPFLWRLFVGVAKTPNLSYQNFGHSNMNVLTNSLHEVCGVSNSLSNTYIIAPTNMAAIH